MSVLRATPTAGGTYAAYQPGGTFTNAKASWIQPPMSVHRRFVRQSRVRSRVTLGRGLPRTTTRTCDEHRHHKDRDEDDQSGMNDAAECAPRDRFPLGAFRRAVVRPEPLPANARTFRHAADRFLPPGPESGAPVPSPQRGCGRTGEEADGWDEHHSENHKYGFGVHRRATLPPRHWKALGTSRR